MANWAGHPAPPAVLRGSHCIREQCTLGGAQRTTRKGTKTSRRPWQTPYLPSHL